MGYRFLLFDIDDTLLDFAASEKECFKSMMEEMGEAWTEEMYKVYKEINAGLWRQIEKKEITVQECVNRRFSDLMARYGRDVDGAAWERIYRGYLNQAAMKMPQVEEVLERLIKEGYELYVITNGVAKTQEARMSKAGLDRYFKEMFISGRIGAEKPAKEFFDYVKSHVPGFRSAEVLVIGDSLSSDIKGGIDAGIDTCWFTRVSDTAAQEKMLEENGLKPDYIIGTLGEIFDILLMR